MWYISDYTVVPKCRQRPVYDVLLIEKSLNSKL